MKTVFDSKELPHIYAHQSAPSGRCAASMSFDGDSFYSYAAKIGKRIKRKRKVAYLLNRHSYSNTTSRHQGRLASAIPAGETVFRTFNHPIDKVTGTTLLKESLQLAAECALKAEKARTADAWHRVQQARWLEQAAAVKEFFGLKAKIPDVSQVVEKLKRAKIEQAKREAAQQRKIERDAQDAIQKWLAGESNHIPSAVGKVYLRRNWFDGQVYTETSKGVRVPLADAERAFRLAIARREKGWHRNGETFAVGNYQLDEVSARGIKAGCHFVEWAQVESFAKAQGWV